MDIITKFFKAYFEGWQMEHYLKFNAKDFGLTKENYWDVVFKKNEFEVNSFESIEKKLDTQLPIDFKSFYTSYYTLEKNFDSQGITLAGVTEKDGLTIIGDYFFNHGLSDDLRSLSLVPFGYYEDEWYICLDMNSNFNNPAIVLFEMSNYGAGKDAISHRQWFSDFNSFIKCWTSLIEIGDPALLYSIDPGNNFLNAYDYWS